MRRRILLSILAVTLVAVTVLGLPLLVLSWGYVTENARAQLTGEAETLAVAVEDRLRAGELTRAELDGLTAAGRRVEVRSADGRVLAAGPDPGRSPLRVTVPIAGGGTLTLARDAGDLNRRRARAAALVIGLAAAAVAVAAVLAVRIARRFTLPLGQLASDASRLAAGDLGPTGRRYGAEELDHVAEALDSAAVRLGDLVRRERRLAADVSHQLRSRLTALSMRLEEVVAVADPEVRVEAEAALDQVDRMVRIVDELLDQARTERAHNAVPVDVTEQLAALRADWADAFRVSGRELRIETADGAAGPAGMPGELRALATPGHVAQALGVLVENALQHGAGAVTVAARGHGEHVVVEVRDEGHGVPDPLVPLVFDRGVSGGDGTGLGLAVARALVEADSGRLELRSAHPAVFAVYLPRVPAGAVLPPDPA